MLLACKMQQNSEQKRENNKKLTQKELGNSTPTPRPSLILPDSFQNISKFLLNGLCCGLLSSPAAQELISRPQGQFVFDNRIKNLTSISRSVLLLSKVVL